MVWTRPLRRHFIFPVLLFIVLSLVIGEFYPFSPFSMYSNPSPEPLRYCYLADGEGQPLPVFFHTGYRPARITKQYKSFRTEIAEKEERRQTASPDYQPRYVLPDGEDKLADTMAVREASGLKVLKFLRERSYQKADYRHLTGGLQLVEVAISAQDNRLVEGARVVATLPAVEGAPPQPPYEFSETDEE